MNLSIVVEWMAGLADCIIVIWFTQRYYGKRISWLKSLLGIVVLLLISQLLTESYYLQTISFPAVLALFQVLWMGTGWLYSIILALAINFSIAYINIAVIQTCSLLARMTVEEMTRSGSIWRTIVLFSCKAVLFLLAVVVLKIQKKYDAVLKREWKLGMVSVLCLFIVVTGMGRILVYVSMGFYYRIILLVTFLSILIFFGILIILFHRINMSEWVEQENQMLYRMLVEQKKRLLNGEKLYEKTREIRHDMKRYFTIFREMLRNQEYQQLNEYIDNILDYKLTEQHEIYLENHIINTVINEKVLNCQNEQIQMEIEISGRCFPEEDMEKEKNLEVALALSNVLENAVEAERGVEEDKRFIKLEIFSIHNMINIIVSNYIMNSVMEENPQLITSKQEKELHGIGIKNVRRIVEQYDGNVSILERKHLFIVHICIPQ